MIFHSFSVALQKTLRHYEIFHKDDVVHRVVKRGAKHSTNPFNVIKEVEFTTLGKNFRLILHPHRDVLHSKFRAYAVDADGNETVVHMGMYTPVIVILVDCIHFLLRS